MTDLDSQYLSYISIPIQDHPTKVIMQKNIELTYFFLKKPFL